jgi:hypothetical protein
MEDGKAKFERYLDAGLKHYANAEPRPGLEGRLLAAVRGEGQWATGWRRQWQLGLAVAGILVAGAAWFLNRHPASPGYSAAATSASARQPTLQSIQPVATADPVARRRTQGSRPRVVSRIEESDDSPRLEQFPSSQPLNEQEEMLARYVRERRQEAVMVSRARAELRKQDLAHFAEELPPEEQQDLQQ